MTQALPTPAVNPFATCYVRPGAMPFLFPPAVDAASLVGRFQAHGWLGSIVGPHGSGKSTLLETLRPELRRTGRRVTSIALHDGERSLPRSFPRPSPSAQTILVVDGYEQLSAWNRWRLQRRCHREGCGLLVTSHRPTRLPELFRTAADCELLQRLVARLLAEQLFAEQLPSEAGISSSTTDIRQAFARHGENLREASSFYDLHESRRAPIGAILTIVSTVMLRLP